MSRTSMVIVRDGMNGEALATALRRTGGESLDVHTVGDVYDALAEVAARRDEAPVEMVAVPLRAAGDEPRAVRDAFRRVDPAVRLVLLAPRGAGVAANDAGFDRVLYLTDAAGNAGATAAANTVGFEDLAVALQRRPPNAEGQSEPYAPATSTETVGAEDPTAGARVMWTERRPPVRAAAESAPERPTTRPAQRDVVDLVIGDALEAFATRTGRTARPATKDAEPTAAGARPAPIEPPLVETTVTPLTTDVGDTDLANAVVAGGDRLVALTLGLIRAELGVEDVRLLDAEAPLSEDRPHEARAAVRDGDRTIAQLASTQAPLDALQPWADWLVHWLRLDREHQELARLAWTDELTGAGNRRAFEKRLDETIAVARRERRAVTLMYFDIDDFKRYNDRFGHDAGDQVLREVVELLRAVIRRGDHVFRVGGDEFVVIFADARGTRLGPPGQGIESVATIAHRFRDRVADLRLTQLGLDAPGTVSVSAGVATYPWDGYDARSLLAHADQLALHSKRSGKNAITFGPGAKDHCQGS